MRLSSSLPPAGFTRAEPSPPGRRRAVLPALALVLGAGLVLAIGYAATPAVPARTAGPDAATPSPSAKPSAKPSAAPPHRPAPGVTRPGAGAPAAHQTTSAPHRGRSAPEHHRPAAPRRPRPRPPAKHTHKRTPGHPTEHEAHETHARPPSWIARECRRRFPDDPLRRRACVAVLTDQFGR
ncbi:hypothetical protein ABTW95_31585 [Spirillospora sp. NPDC127506]